MKYVIVIAGILSLAGCSSFSPLTAIAPGNAGNPNAAPYVGSPGSAYDQAANPPRLLGTVTYNPDAPVPPPAGLEMPPSSSMPVPATPPAAPPG